MKNIRYLLVITLFAAALMGLFTLNMTTSSHAAVNSNDIVVTTTDDAHDENDGFCSLREALINANKNAAVSNNAGECTSGSASSTDRILLVNGATYALTEIGVTDDTGDLDIVDFAGTAVDVELTTAESGAAATINAAAVIDRVIEVQEDATAVISNVIVRGGISDYGAGVLNNGGTVTMTNVIVQNNTAIYGAGIVNRFGTMALIDSQVMLNSATIGDGGDGGGIHNVGDSSVLHIENSLVRANTADDNGGGIFNSDAQLIIDSDSQINLNRSGSHGGGIASESGTIEIANSTMEGNEAGFDGDDSARGGAIYTPNNNDGSVLIIDQTTIEGNEASQSGGGLFAFAITMTNSYVGDNESENSGGGIFAGSIALSHTEIAHNETTVDGAGAGLFASTIIGHDLYIHDNVSGGVAGGIWADALELDRSRVISNTAVEEGGGIYLRENVGLITNSVVALNQASSDGAGIYVKESLTLGNVTISSNQANNGGRGGGIFIAETAEVAATNVTIALNLLGLDVYKAGELTLQNSIIHTPDTPNCFFVATPINSLGNNLSDDASCSGLTEAGDKDDANVALEPLMDNGGNTLTHALGTGSDAIDAGDDTACTTSLIGGLDQRGLTRTAGESCDIGAFEIAYVVMLPFITR